MRIHRSDAAIYQFILKVASRCNLNCTYCYVYNQADSSWRSRPAIMSEATFLAAIEGIRRHCLITGQHSVSILFHGGEPTLIGWRKFRWMCDQARRHLEDIVDVSFSIQTNGTLFNEDWIEAIKASHVHVGVSLDGPRLINDTARVDHKGRGSYRAVADGIAMLRDAGVGFTLLCVIQPGANSVEIHRHFLSLGCRSISYLLPACTHETVRDIRNIHGPTPCADYLIPIFDEWWFGDTLETEIREFWNAGRVIMGGESELDSLGNRPLRFVAVETDGALHGLDKLRSCEDGLTDLELNVHEDDFIRLEERDGFSAIAMRGVPLPTGCSSCQERTTCAGGYLPHRYSKIRQFDNPSVWCADLLALLAHIRQRLNVSHDQTDIYRHQLLNARNAVALKAQ